MKIVSFFFKHPVIRFVCAGGTSAVVNLAILYLFTDIFHIHYLISGIIAFSVAVIVSFFLQKKWTFEDHSTENTHRKFTLYVVIGLVNLVANTILLYICTDLLDIYHMLSQIIASGLVAIWSFFIYRHLVFDAKEKTTATRRILVITQKVNKEDPVLGFFHAWIVGLSKKFESVTVICLEKGVYDLPENVKVLSLGKEERQSKLQYIIHFYWYIFSESKNYEAVFVHMNQEYILLGAVPWRILNKTFYMWRNHVSGGLLTKVAVRLCDKVFCTSEFSYTARYSSTVIMPVGIDTEIFKKKESIPKIPKSVLFLGRISPIKKPHMLCEAFAILDKRGIKFRASIYGNPLPADVPYHEGLKTKVIEEGLASKVSFYPGIPNYKAVDIYNEHEVSINLSPSGLYDKTIFEAMASESMMLASSKSLYGLIPEDFIFKEGSVEDLAKKLEKLLSLGDAEKKERGKDLRAIVVGHHSLALLMDKLAQEIV